MGVLPAMTAPEARRTFVFNDSEWVVLTEWFELRKSGCAIMATSPMMTINWHDSSAPALLSERFELCMNRIHTADQPGLVASKYQPPWPSTQPG